MLNRFVVDSTVKTRRNLSAVNTRSYIAKTDVAGVSRATQIYPSPARANLRQVAQLIAIWNGDVFTDLPVAADGEKVVFGFEQVVEAQSAPECPSDMVHVPDGTFSMGSPASVGDADEHPQYQVTLSGYCIDRTEVTVEAYTRCVAGGRCTAAPEPGQDGLGSLCNGMRADRQNHPINCVDWDQATAYCAFVNKRLPSGAEWEYAARGGDGRTYPWGNEAPSAKRLNACGSECRAVRKRLGLGDSVMYEDNDGWEATAPVGSFQSGVSPFGALDMAGNVWEWTADWYGAYTTGTTGTSVNPHGPEEGIARVLRGGGWGINDASGVRGAYRDWYGQAVRYTDLGLRCARGD
jgi:formylglycine-generating enzyme required for sulfatase activity